MSLEQTLRDELEREIEEEVGAIRRHAEEQGKALLEDAERQAQEKEQEAAGSLAEECDLRIRRTLARTDLEKRNALLRRKQQELDRVFELAAEKLSHMQKTDVEAYARIMRGVFDNCRSFLPPANLKIRLGPGLEILEKGLSSEGGVTVDHDDALFGIQVEADNGKVRCDATVPRLLERLRREREADLEDMLFGESS